MADQERLSFKERFQSLAALPRFFRLVWQTNSRLFSLNAILRLVKATIPFLQLYLGKLIIDEVVLLIEQENPDLTTLWTYVLAELLLALLNDLLNRAITLTENLLGDLFANHSSEKIMEHAASLDLEQFENSAFYDKLERARRQTLGRTVLLSQTLYQLQDVVTVVSLALGLVFFNPWLILILLVGLLPAFLAENHFNQKSYSLTRSWTPQRRELDYLRYIGASDETAKEVKIFGLADFLVQRFHTVAYKYYLENKQLAVRRATWGYLLSIIGTAAYYLAYVLIIIATVAGRITLGDLTFLSGSFMRLRATMEAMLNRFNQIAEGTLYLQDFFDFFDLKPRITKKKGSKPFPKPIKEGITFDGVSFKYQNTDRWALRNVSFHLPVGAKIALVGENGAGKTTLTKLLTRLYEPVEGNIYIDGVNLKELDPEDLRQQIGVIFQDYYRYQLTAGENIAVGKIEDRNKEDKIVGAAKLSRADEVISSLPDQYEQMIGRRFAEGIDLSGGQWQKIALSRAYIRDAQLLILDEPTASLDARAEHDIFTRFAELTKGKTAILISHRFSTVRMADKILVLEGGEVLEFGTHDDLMEKEGRYAELFTLQAEGYR